MIKQDSVISPEIHDELNTRVQKFNEQKFSKIQCKYTISIKGRFIYLDYLYPDGSLDKVARLTFNGDVNKMSFAIYKYSTEKYDPNEFFFPGNECINGTIEGAMKAGIKAYGPQDKVALDSVFEKIMKKLMMLDS